MKPQVLSLDALPTTLGNEIDFFICSASYEDRCLSIPSHLADIRIKNPLICAHEEFKSYLKDNLASIENYLGAGARKIIAQHNNPVIGTDQLHSAIKAAQTEKPQSFVVDATTFTHEGLLILIALLANTMKSDDRLQVVYAPAKRYAIGKADEERWLSRGVQSVRSVLGYPGLFKPAQKMHLVVMVGFETERVRLLIEACEPDGLSLGCGNDSTDEANNHLVVNESASLSLSGLYPNVRRFGFSCVDFEATRTALEQHVSELSGYNVMLAPMNTKLSTIGAALFAISEPRVQLCYAPAVTYNVAAYSEPGDHCVLFDLPAKRYLPSTSAAR